MAVAEEPAVIGGERVMAAPAVVAGSSSSPWFASTAAVTRHYSSAMGVSVVWA